MRPSDLIHGADTITHTEDILGIQAHRYNRCIQAHKLIEKKLYLINLKCDKIHLLVCPLIHSSTFALQQNQLQQIHRKKLSLQVD